MNCVPFHQLCLKVRTFLLSHKKQPLQKQFGAILPRRILIPKSVQYVVDGGALLHRIPWTHGSTFVNILDSYGDYEVKKYGKATIVFDAYIAVLQQRI